MNHENKELDELRARLLKDTASAEEAEQLLPVMRSIQRRHTPKPSAKDTARLVDQLAAEMPTQYPRDTLSPISNPQSPAPKGPPVTSLQRLRSSWFLLLLRAQMRIVRREIWAASALMMTLGMFVTLSTFAPSASDETLPLVFMAPIVAAIGVAFLYGHEVDPAFEIELATPVSPRLVLLARLALVFALDLALGLLASGVLAVLRFDIDFWPMVSAWLAPMAFLSALAFLLTIVSNEPLLGTLISLGLWIFQAIRQSPGAARLFWYIPNLWSVDAHAWLWVLALLFGTLALWLAGSEERWIRGSLKM